MSNEWPVVGNGFIDRFVVTIDGQQQSVTIAPYQTSLVALLAAGIDAPHSCTQGHCGACMASLKTGQVSMASTQALLKRNIEHGYIFACQARPSAATPLHLDFDF